MVGRLRRRPDPRTWPPDLAHGGPPKLQRSNGDSGGEVRGGAARGGPGEEGDGRVRSVRDLTFSLAAEEGLTALKLFETIYYVTIISSRWKQIRKLKNVDRTNIPYCWIVLDFSVASNRQFLYSSDSCRKFWCSNFKTCR